MRPRRDRGATWWKVLLGCAGLSFVAFLLVGYVAYKKIRAAIGDSLVLDPAKIEALEDRVVPGARLPNGFHGKFGVDTAKMRMALFLDAQNETLCVLAMPIANGDKKISREDLQGSMEKSLQKNSDKRHEVVVRSQPIELATGGKTVPGLRRVVERSGARRLEITVYGHPLGDPKTAVVILGALPKEDGNDAFFKEYLLSVKLEPMADQ